MSKYVDISEKVTATFYDEEHEEWTKQTVTIEDVLDSVCDDYTILPSAEPTLYGYNIEYLAGRVAEMIYDEQTKLIRKEVERWT